MVTSHILPLDFGGFLKIPVTDHRWRKMRRLPFGRLDVTRQSLDSDLSATKATSCAEPSKQSISSYCLHLLV